MKTMNSEHWFKTIGHSWIKDFTDRCNALIAFFLNITYLFRLVCKPIAFMPYCKMLHGCLYGEWNILTVTKFAGLRLLCSFWWTWIYHLNKYESIKKPKLKITKWVQNVHHTNRSKVKHIIVFILSLLSVCSVHSWQ